jgi:hypothetical protein
VGLVGAERFADSPAEPRVGALKSDALMVSFIRSDIVPESSSDFALSTHGDTYRVSLLVWALRLIVEAAVHRRRLVFSRASTTRARSRALLYSTLVFRRRVWTADYCDIFINSLLLLFIIIIV